MSHPFAAHSLPLFAEAISAPLRRARAATSQRRIQKRVMLGWTRPYGRRQLQWGSDVGSNRSGWTAVGTSNQIKCFIFLATLDPGSWEGGDGSFPVTGDLLFPSNSDARTCARVPHSVRDSPGCRCKRTSACHGRVGDHEGYRGVGETATAFLLRRRRQRRACVRRLASASSGATLLFPPPLVTLFFAASHSAR